MSDIDNVCFDILSHPREMFVRNMSSLVGEKFHNLILKGCRLNPRNDMADLFLADGNGSVRTFRGFVRRHEMDYSANQLKTEFDGRIGKALKHR